MEGGTAGPDSRSTFLACFSTNKSVLLVSGWMFQVLSALVCKAHTVAFISTR